MSDQVEITPELAATAARAFFRLHAIIQEMEAACRVIKRGEPTVSLAYKQALNTIHIQMHQLLPPSALKDVPA